jgi:hypothetical protein
MWQRVTVETGSKTAFDELFNIIGDVPIILGRAYSLPSINDQSVLLKKSAVVIRLLLAAAGNLESWSNEFLKASSTPQYWLVPSRAKNPADVDLPSKIFPLCYEFKSIRVSVPILMCWSVSTQLYSNIIQIYDLVRGRLGFHLELDDILAQADITGANIAIKVVEILNQNGSSLPRDKACSIHEIRNQGAKMARSVCQSVEYHHQAVMGTFGGQSTTYPAWSARQYFRFHKCHERELTWLQNARKMEGPDTGWGLATMAFTDIVEPLGGWPI